MVHGKVFSSYPPNKYLQTNHVDNTKHRIQPVYIFISDERSYTHSSYYSNEDNSVAGFNFSVALFSNIRKAKLHASHRNVTQVHANSKKCSPLQGISVFLRASSCTSRSLFPAANSVRLDSNWYRKVVQPINADTNTNASPHLSFKFQIILSTPFRRR